MKWIWRDPGDPSRPIELDFNYWTGAKQLRVGGELVPTKNKLMGWSHEVALGPRRATVRVRVKYLAVPEATLEIDGSPVAPAEAPRPLPAWTWAFVAANIAILVASRGGAIPGAIAGVGAVGAIGAARSNLGLAPRLALAALATGAAWAAFAALAHNLGG